MDEEVLRKYIKMTGEIALLEAKAFKSWIAYQNEKGQLVREYWDGRIEVREDEKGP